MRKDLFGAAFLFGTIFWLYNEDFSAACRIVRTLRVERTLDANEPDRRVVLHLRDRIVLQRLPVVVPDQIEARAIVRGNERRADKTRPGPNRNSHFKCAVSVRGHADVQADAPIRPDMRTLAIDDERELLIRNEAAYAVVLNRELVFAIGREIVLRDDAAAQSPAAGAA